jgi:hypothetical protein
MWKSTKLFSSLTVWIFFGKVPVSLKSKLFCDIVFSLSLSREHSKTDQPAEALFLNIHQNMKIREYAARWRTYEHAKNR